MPKVKTELKVQKVILAVKVLVENVAQPDAKVKKAAKVTLDVMVHKVTKDVMVHKAVKVLADIVVAIVMNLDLQDLVVNVVAKDQQVKRVVMVTPVAPVLRVQ